YLLLTLKIMFEEPDRQDAIWRNQKSVHGLELVKRWKLLTLCGVHVITLSIVQLFLLVIRRYPLLRFTLEQLVNVARLQVEEEKSEARKNMIFYLTNTEGYKMDFFKGMTYDEILPIFQDKFDANMRFLFKSREEMEEEDEKIIKSINETPTRKAAKRRKLSEEAQEAEDLRNRLEIVQDKDDDVFVEATPLAQKSNVDAARLRLKLFKDVAAVADEK
nr:hypothetical protein [Tanacetum cinerariifolium]